MNVDWAGEIMPFTADAKERLDRELMVNSYYHSSTLQVIKLANRYFPEIEMILREYNIPDDFKYLAVLGSINLLWLLVVTVAFYKGMAIGFISSLRIEPNILL